MGIAKEQDGVIRFKTPVGIMKDVFSGIQADLIEVFTVVAMAFTRLAVYLVGFKSFQLYFGIEIGSRCVPLLMHGAKLRKSNGIGFPMIDRSRGFTGISFDGNK